MKALYETPEVERIDFAAMERIAAIPDSESQDKSIDPDGDDFE